jgi:hypothetical protein
MCNNNETMKGQIEAQYSSINNDIIKYNICVHSINNDTMKYNLCVYSINNDAIKYNKFILLNDYRSLLNLDKWWMITVTTTMNILARLRSHMLLRI